MRAWAVLFVCALCPAARAESSDGTTWLSGSSRALPLTTSASRDAPVFEYAYGPRAQLSFGHDLATYRVRGPFKTWRFGMSGVLAMENAQGGSPIPTELGRGSFSATTALELPHAAARWFGRGSDLELTLGIGHELARQTRAGQGQSYIEAPRTHDIAFGGGGTWLSLDVATRLRLGEKWTLTSRLGERFFVSAFPLLVGDRWRSDAAADFIADGLIHAPSAELDLRWRLSASAQPFVSLFGEALVPHDVSAKDGVGVRLLGGVALPGQAGELSPFVSVDAGNGKGLLVNRRELRLSFGVRHAFE